MRAWELARPLRRQAERRFWIPEERALAVRAAWSGLTEMHLDRQRQQVPAS